MMTRNDQLAIAGASLAMTDAGLEIDSETAGRAGVFVGSNKEIVDPNHRALVTAACCYDRLRKHARLHHRALHPTAPYHVLAVLVAGHSVRRGDTETLARQLKKLAERPCGTNKN